MDMRAEREELVKRVFPQLRKLCEQRGVTWGEVDLRWGVTDEQKADGKVLPICLEEIQRCRPYFIGLLGERYGWVPDEIPQDIIRGETWLTQHPDCSVTELEILHGVLNNPEVAEHAFFYLRDVKASIKVENELIKEPNYYPESEDSLAKLKLLKKKIKESGCPVRENYSDPKTLGELVLKDLTSVIDWLYPAESQPDPLDREAAEHEAFTASRARVYIERTDYFERLDKHIEGYEPPLVLLGEPGVGKSALLANWALRRRDSVKIKDIPGREPLFLLHFTGAGPYSADWMAMLRRIMGEFKRHFDIRDNIPDPPDELRAAFPNWLYMVAARGRMVLIIDGLNQLEDRDGALDLVWLPPNIPDNIRLILSTLPGRPLDELWKRGWPMLSVAPLVETERQRLVIKYLDQYRKSLNPAQVERIVNSKQAANPLYLRVLLEELRVYGDHATLNERINHYLKADTISDLYGRVLQRYEEDYERDRLGLVRDAMSLIWAARRGLSEAELLDMLGSNGEPLPRAYWSPFYLAAESLLVNCSGLIDFNHDYFRQAVRERFLSDARKQQVVHLKLADYLDKCEIGKRKVDELPWQLVQARTWKRLYDLLAFREFFITAWDTNEFEVKAYWVQVEGNSSLRMMDAYRTVLDSQGEDTNLTWRLSSLLYDMGHLEEALKLRAYLVDHFRSTHNKNGLQRSLGNQALILHDRGELSAAMSLYKEQERICRELGDKEGLQSCLGNQALILHNRGDLDAAMAMHKEKEQICRELGNKDGLQRALGNQALILKDKGKLNAAMILFKEKERICRELGNKNGLQKSLGNQALILHDRGEMDTAMALYKEKERICRELGKKDGIAISLTNQALILGLSMNHPRSALPLVDEAYHLASSCGYASLTRQIDSIRTKIHQLVA